MTIRWLPRSTSARDAEQRLPALTDGQRVVVAVEVFDHPEARPAQRTTAEIGKGEMTGPWLIGDEAEVYAELERLGYRDYAEQASAGLGRREHDG